ncbi:MAG: hypothetical protein LBM07_05120 [Culturomica sp.]|jgi:hypothetical protein|nr:hypothetical protein [Culturomica sp.]
MASIRRLKKDIDYLTFAVIADSLNYSLNNSKGEDEVSKIIAEVINMRNEMRIKIVNPTIEEGEKNAVKKYYRGIWNEVLKTVDSAFTKLSETVSSGK